MLRDRNLIPLSHQHQHALALCVQIERGLRLEKPDLTTPARAKAARAGDAAQHWQQEIARLFESEIRFHFEAEEKVLFPFAERAPSLRDLVDELRIEHASLRQYAASAAAGRLSVPELQLFAASLAAHVRKEERRLFEGIQEFFSGEELAKAGAELDSYFLHSGMPGASCALRPEKNSR
ncbi:MAG: hemerythrin domain-containing protein [Acidobacteriia bacterium]|nr:hemerythrin domain-containing protein [Terriglobia bacterium]